jgi:hypothetical protein
MPQYSCSLEFTELVPQSLFSKYMAGCVKGKRAAFENIRAAGGLGNGLDALFFAGCYLNFDVGHTTSVMLKYALPSTLQELPSTLVEGIEGIRVFVHMHHREEHFKGGDLWIWPLIQHEVAFFF